MPRKINYVQDKTPRKRRRLYNFNLSLSREILSPLRFKLCKPQLEKHTIQSIDMAIARTGVFVDDYLECNFLLQFTINFSFKLLLFFNFSSINWFCNFYEFCNIDASTLPAELQRLLNTIRELDDRSQGITFLHFPVYLM